MTNENKRYHLVLPEELYIELQSAAAGKGTTVVSLLRRFIRLGLLALKTENDAGSALVYEDGTRRRRILFTKEDMLLTKKAEQYEKEEVFEVL